MTNSRLDKTINGLRNTVERHGKEETIEIHQDLIVINQGSNLWGTVILLIMVFVVYPISTWAYYNFFDDPNNIVGFLSMILIGGTAFNIYKIVKGSTILTLNFKNNFLKIENSNKIFKQLLPLKQVEFADIDKVELIDRMGFGKYQNWKILYLFDNRKNKILLTEFEGNYPDNVIASDLKFLFEVIIWSQKG